MRFLILYIIGVLFISNSLFAQTTFVPDANLRRVLVSRYPFYLDFNQNIKDAQAATLTTGLDCSFQNVSDLTGLSKFTGINSFSCQLNSISNIDLITSFPNLVNLYCFNNNITKLPELNTLTKLAYISCGSNKLTAMPDLSSNILVWYLDCSHNSISEIKGLSTLVNLQTLLIFENNFDSLPDLSKLTKLQTIICHRNKLKAISGLQYLTELTQLTAGENNFESLPDMSALTKMNQINIWKTALKAAPDIRNMANLFQLSLESNDLTEAPNFAGNPKLRIIKLNGNKISKITDISACKNNLKVLKLSDNLLDSIPDLSSFSPMDTLTIENNRLTFEDVIPVVKNNSITYKTYAPQQAFGIDQEVMLTEMQTYEYDFGIDKAVLGNEYTWYKNGVFYLKTSSPKLYFQQTKLADSGIYTCEVRNAQAPLLILKSKSLTINVKKCFDLSKLSYTATDYNCNIGAIVTIDESSILGGQTPFSYTLISTELGSLHYAYNNKISNLFENRYTLEVKDKTGCKATYEFITLKGKKGTECKNLVLSDDDNSSNKSVLFDEVGVAKIYDKQGQLIKTLATPNIWDGKNQSGEFVPGYYVIDLNGTIMNITLIK